MLESLPSLAFYIKIFVALLVVVNPLGIIPIFVAMSGSNSDAQKKVIARVAAQTVAVVLLICALLGERVLEVFGISIASFKVGGAILIMLNAMAMMQAAPSRIRQTPEEAQEATEKASIAVVPLGIPLLAGPGAMSTMVIYSSHSRSVVHIGAVVLIALAIALVTWMALRIATRVGAHMSVTTVNVATRIMGLLLAALAVEIFAGGIVELIPALGKPDVFRYGQ